MSDYNRGEIWLLDLNPTLGSEINKTRPAVIISRSDYNKIAETMTVVPVSSGRFISSFHTRISKLKKDSHAVIPQVRVATKKRFIKKMGKATAKEMDDIKAKLGFYLDLL